jgi:hypothetical protein
MQSDDDLQTTLSKWPFILGDVLLVGTALAIAIFGGWQLSGWQVAACVVSVALGAALYVLPYVIEYQVRVREVAEDRSAERRILRHQIATCEAELGEVSERLDELRSISAEWKGKLANLPAPPPDLSGPLRATEAKLAPLMDARASQQAQLDKLSEQVSALADAFHNKVDPRGFEKTVSELAQELESLKAAIKARADGPVEENLLPEPAEVAVDAGGVEPTQSPVHNDHKASVSRPTRSPRKRRGVERRLLQRAIESKQDNPSAAVSRIIGAQQNGTVQTPNPVPEAEVPDDSKVTSAEKQPLAEADMFADSVPSRPSQTRRTKKRDTAVIASVFIGIGNKPYLRGSGGGLSWEQGIAMEFEEIGKWRWIAPDQLERPVEFQVFRNDADADSSGTHTLEPGQQLEIVPEF